MTLLGVAVAGFLLWLGSQILPSRGEPTAGEMWTALGLVALAGLTMAVSQLLGGWTKWGWPRVSFKVFLIGFLPALVLGGWVLAAGEPGHYWLGSHVRDWSDDIGIDGAVKDLTSFMPAIAFGIGLVFGLTFDTTGPRARPAPTTPEHKRADTDGKPADSRRVHIREGASPATPEPEPAPRSGEPPKE